METLDLPRIDAALIDEPQRTAVAVAAAASIDLEKVDLATLAIAKLGDWRPIVAKLKADNEKTVHDLSTQAKIDDAISLRHRTINKPLAAARKMEEALASNINGARKKLGAELKALETGYADAALPLTAQIDAAQQVIDDKKAADKLAEDNRLAGLRATVDQIMQKWLDRASAEGITAERIGAGMAMLTDMAMPAELADVSAHWTAEKAATVAAMTKLQLNKLLADKAERDREDADIDRLNELANDCVARKFLEVRDRLAEFDTLLMPSVSPTARVQAVAAVARERIVALMEAAREDGDIADIVAIEAHCLLGASASLIEVCLADFDNDLTPSLSQAQRVRAAAAAARARIVALLEEAQQAEEAAKNSTELAPTGEGKAGTPGTCNAEAAPIMYSYIPGGPPVFAQSDDFGVIVVDAAVPNTQEQHPQQVLKAEPATADATDRGTAANVSPRGGAMGAGRAAAAATVWVRRADESATLNLDAIGARLGFALKADFISGTLHIKATTIERGMPRFRESDFSRICAALIEHVENVRMLQAA